MSVATVSEPVSVPKIENRSAPSNGKAENPPMQSGDRLSRAEYERRYNLHPEIKKAELIEGEVYVASPVQIKKHSRPHFNMITWLGTYCAATPYVNGADNATVSLDMENEPQPDILLRLDAELGGRSWITADDYLEGAPELVVEIAASSASYDLGKKKRVYARNGVQEYIVFVAYEKQIYWFALGEEGYEPLVADANGVIRSKIFPGLWLQTDVMRTDNLTKALNVLQEGLASPEHAAFVEKLIQDAEKLNK